MSTSPVVCVAFMATSCRPAPVGQAPSGSLVIAALATLLASIGVFSALALTFSAFDYWRLGGEVYSTPSKISKVLPSCPSDWLLR